MNRNINQIYFIFKNSSINIPDESIGLKLIPSQLRYLYPNQCELGLIKTEFSIRINSNESDVGIIRIDSD